ncbi:MAG TPA: exodeoxyribonuclease VII large subunit [Fibrobacteria bacterium]|nr:exodeoxyribonuclease VII large subunit [Fibrobacteria bacterium]
MSRLIDDLLAGASGAPEDASGSSSGAPEAVSTERKAYTVEQYNKAVERKMKEFPKIWVKGVLTQVNRRGKVVYMELGDFAEGDARPKAVLPVMMWAWDFDQFSARFAQLPTPFAIRPELKVSLLLESSYYVPTGKFQPRVVDVDESFTLGELAQMRQKVLERLRREGLFDANRSRALAEVPLRVGLISAQGSAAYQDFTTVLLQSGFSFSVVFAEARMQGQETESTVAAALVALTDLRLPPLDVICIIRGGGSKTDLVFFDSEAICRAIALCPIPVFTGIGHEIDLSLADMVANRHFKTPTECAKFLEERAAEVFAGFAERAARLRAAWESTLQERIYELRGVADSLRTVWGARRRGEADRAALSRARLGQVARRLLRMAAEKVSLDGTGLTRGPRKLLALGRERFTARGRAVRSAWRAGHEAEAGRLVRAAVGLRRGPGKSLALQKATLENAARILRLADPLQRGYARIYRAGEGGKAIGSAAEARENESILIRFHDGSVGAKVDKIGAKENEA